MSLEPYRRKRQFAATPEPRGAVRKKRERPRFVVQEHHARRIHWDLRLEMDGVLRSWAIPRGPSLDPGDKRLAVLVEDHPVEYGDFEGVIPPGNYGAGTVMLWDRGTYVCREGDPAEAFRQGKLTLDLFGEKLRGEFHFVRTKRNDGRDWLLFKGKDEFAVSGFSPSGTRSVKSGRTIEEIRADQDARWTARPPDAPPERARPDPFPRPFRPMLAQSAERPFNRRGWLFEIKWDGVRALAFVRRSGSTQEVSLYSRTLRRLNAQFPEVVEALSHLEVSSAVLDGEIIAPDERGQPSFARLQQRLNLEHEADVRQSAERVPVIYAAFDCLYLRGRDLRERPFADRRRALETLALPQGVIRSDVVEEQGLTLFEAAQRLGLEGIIAKRAGSPYRPGERSGDWQKTKVRRTLEAVVGGMTRGKGHRRHSFGALVLGQFDPASGVLVHIGQAGGGLKDADLRLLQERLDPLIADVSPFAVPPSTLQPAVWVRPEVVVEVEYAERTPDGLLRFPVFLRVRDDVRARDVLLPSPRTAPPAGTGDGSGTPGARARASGAQPPSPPAVAFTNLDKVFFPELGVTKGDVIAYYRRIASYILPHLRDRPLSLRRFPDGIHGEDFFQKDVPDAPEFVRTERIWSDQGDRDIRMVICDDETTLLWLAQMGCIEIHAWFSRVTAIRGARRPAARFSGSEEAIALSPLNYPDFVVFDIDPFLFPKGKAPVKRHGEYDPDYSRQGFEAARKAALWLGEALEGLGLRAFAKTSGKTGLHVFLPIARRYTYAQTHAFAKTVVTWLVDGHPEALTAAWAVPQRVGKVFLDYNQNVRGKTLASVYSLRPVPEATVSVPVTWEELKAGFDPLAWTYATVFDRLTRVGDLWAGILDAAQGLDLIKAKTR